MQNAIGIRASGMNAQRMKRPLQCADPNLEGETQQKVQPKTWDFHDIPRTATVQTATLHGRPPSFLTMIRLSVRNPSVFRAYFSRFGDAFCIDRRHVSCSSYLSKSIPCQTPNAAPAVQSGTPKSPNIAPARARLILTFQIFSFSSWRRSTEERERSEKERSDKKKGKIQTIKDQKSKEKGKLWK